VLFFLVHLAMRRLLRVFARSSGVAALEVENAVLRHQLAVLGRRVKRPPLRRRDRLLLAAASGLLPRDRWSVPSGARLAVTVGDPYAASRWLLRKARVPQR